MTIVPNVRVPMDDGVTLNATVGYPTEPVNGGAGARNLSGHR